MYLGAKATFFIIAAIAIYTYAGYPLILSLLGMFKRRRAVAEPGEWPTVALIISAHNEERIIREKIENSLKLDYPKGRLRVIIASDGSSDSTNDIAREYETRNVVLKAFERREGKSAALNKAVLGLDDEILVFSDANAFYQEDAVRKLVRRFSDEEVGCAVGRLIYLSNHSYVGKGENLYWRYESFLNRLESRLASVLVATGTIFAVRRELFRPIMKDVANDFQLPAEVASQGYAVVYEGEAIAHERATYYFREEFSRKRRIIVRGLTGFRHLRSGYGGPFRVFQFISRKLLRWWVGALLPLLYVANLVLVGDPAFAALFALQNAFYALAIVGAFLRRGGIQSRFLFVPFYFSMVNAASLAALVTYGCGDRLSSWEKAETTRDSHEERPGAAPRLRVIDGKKDLTLEKAKSVDSLEQIT